MIIKTKKIKSNQGETIEQTTESNKPGAKFRKKVVESYRTNIKPGIKETAKEVETKMKKAVLDAGSDLADMIKRK